MKKKNRIWILPLLLIGTTGILTIGCEKDNISPSSDNITNGKSTAIFSDSKTYETMTDQDGNVYKTITIGTQTWMAENLRTTKYRDGSTISEITENETWLNITIGAYCNYNNTKNIDTIATFGRLYNWYAISDRRNLAPAGWHVPTEYEWSQLIDYLGGDNEAGSKLKEIGNTHWLNLNEDATNKTGFTAIPGGLRHGLGGHFVYIGICGFWWSATELDDELVWRYSMINRNSNVDKYNYKKELGLSVRCVKD